MRYASGIKRLVATRRTLDLEVALKAQKSYWLFIGILLLIMIGFWLISLLLNVVLAFR